MAIDRPQDPQQLSPRDREILRDVIHTYIVTGEPVSSRAVAKQQRLGLSAATIRNVMADLEESGYLVQPHTSSGRMPSRAGYHLYIDALMDAPAVPAQQRRYIAENLAAAPAEAEPLMNMTTHLLSELTSQIGIVVTPAMGDTVLKAVDFLPLSETRALCVVVAASGFIDNKVIDLKQPLAREELVRIGNYLTDNFAGLTLRQIRDRLLALMSEERAQVDSLLANAILLARQALAVDSGPEVLVEGTASVLHQPELANVERVRRLLDTFTQRARLVQVLGSLIEGRGVRVVIGADSDLTSELDFSLVATTYGTGGSARGTLGIFGPSRMEYQRVVPLVHFLGEALSQALEAAYGEGAGEAAREGDKPHERRERH